MSVENWLPIPGYPGYEVSDMGRVRSFKKTGFSHLFFSSPKILKATPTHYGYPEVCLRNGRSRRWRVHQLVMLIFVGPCPEGLEVCHNDGDPLNNRLSNLRYDTHTNNMKDIVYRDGTGKSQWLKPEEREWRDRQIRIEYASGQVTLLMLSRKYGVDIRLISRIINGKIRPQAGGPIKGVDYQSK